MAGTAAEIDPRLITFMFPSIPESVRMARFYVRAALGFHELDKYADDAAAITSELVTNAVQHVCDNGGKTIGVTLARAGSPAAVTVIVSDSSPEGPVKRDAPAGSERGRGLQIVEALSAHWGWRPEQGGKAVFAVLVPEDRAVMADISDLPLLHDIDAGYPPQHVKLARSLRDMIESGQDRQDDILPPADLARDYKAPARIAYCALAMLAANRYISRPEAVTSCSVTWQAGT